MQVLPSAAQASIYVAYLESTSVRPIAAATSELDDSSGSLIKHCLALRAPHRAFHR